MKPYDFGASSFALIPEWQDVDEYLAGLKKRLDSEPSESRTVGEIARELQERLYAEARYVEPDKAAWLSSLARHP